MQDRVDGLRGVSNMAADVLSAAMDARIAAEEYRRTGHPRYGERFEAALRELECELADYQAEIGEYDVAFIDKAVDNVRVLGTSPSQSIHDDIQWLALVVGDVAFAVSRELSGEEVEVAVEYVDPDLPDSALILLHIETALDAFFASSPDLDALNRASKMREQELSRAILIACSPSTPPLDDAGEGKNHAHRAHRERLFPKGLPSRIRNCTDIVDLVVKIDAEQTAEKGWDEIAREFTGETGSSRKDTPKARRYVGRIRAMVTKGIVNLARIS
ncbi:MAG: hypothetical protein KF708_22510 [Pirellulales bacterium]|nr:hypothetical protein [Pirellulales bacterium]